MAHVFADRVADTSSTTGQSSFALDNEEPTGYQNFDDVCGDADTIYYAAAHALLDEWEVGLGTYGAGTNVLARTTVLASSNAGSKVTFSSGTKHIIGTLPASVLSNLTDLTISALAGLTLAQGDLIYGTGVDTAATLTKDANATRYLSNTGSSNNPAWAQVNLANGVTGDLPFANLTQGSALSVLGVTGSSTADNASIAAGSDHNILRRSGTAVAFGSIDLSQSGAVGSSVLAAANGGTGLSSLGSGVATWLGTPSSANLISAVTDETGTGSLVFANTPTLVTPLLGTPTSGTLTNCTGFPVAQLAGLGTGVATALAINIGSAGAPVLFNGALGTPSSGTLTNCTGLPSVVVANEATDTTCFLLFVTAATGELAPKSNANLAFNSNTGVLSLTNAALTTPVLGTPSSGTLTNCTGLPSIVVANEATDTTCFLLFATAATGELAPKTNANLAFNSSTGVLSLTSPALTTPVLGTPSSGTLTNCTGLPSIVAANEASDTTCFLAFFTAATGELGPKTNANLAFNSSTGVLSLTAPVLGTPTSGTLSNCTGLPISTGVSGLGTGVATMLASSTGATATITFVIDGGGSEIADGIKGDLEIPFACTITRATMLADQSGSIVVDIWKDTYANYPPTDADSITSATPPTISTATKSQDSTLSSWTTSIAAGDTLRFNVDSCTTITRATLSLRVTKT